jgi:hypothetical protein
MEKRHFGSSISDFGYDRIAPLSTLPPKRATRLPSPRTRTRLETTRFTLRNDACVLLDRIRISRGARAAAAESTTGKEDPVEAGSTRTAAAVEDSILGEEAAT